MVEALRMSLREQGYMGEGSAQRIEINGVSDILIGSRSTNVSLTWSGTELPSSRRGGDLTVVDFSSDSVTIMVVGIERREREGMSPLRTRS